MRVSRSDAARCAAFDWRGAAAASTAAGANGLSLPFARPRRRPTRNGPDHRHQHQLIGWIPTHRLGQCRTTEKQKKARKTGLLVVLLDLVGRPKARVWCPGKDSNLHALRHTDLNRARLPIPPPGQVCGPHVCGRSACVNAKMRVPTGDCRWLQAASISFEATVESALSR